MVASEGMCGMEGPGCPRFHQLRLLHPVLYGHAVTNALSVMYGVMDCMRVQVTTVVVMMMAKATAKRGWETVEQEGVVGTWRKG